MHFSTKKEQPPYRFSQPQVPPWKEFAQKTSTTHPPGDSTTVHLCMFLHWCHTSMHTVENPWEVGSSSFCQNPGGGGGQGGRVFQEKLPKASSYFGFYFIFINKCFGICLGGPIFTLPLTLHRGTPPLTPVCIYDWCAFRLLFFEKLIRDLTSLRGLSVFLQLVIVVFVLNNWQS